jgi:hypothetical protein
MNAAAHDANKPLAPPYVAYSSFKTMISSFKAHVLPSRIDRSVLGGFSGIVGSQLLTALRFLKLIDKDNHPQESLPALTEAFGTDKWPLVLGQVIKAAYAPIFHLDLKVASPSQFAERFAKSYPGEGSTQRKSMSFFLTAILDAKIEISPFILKNKKPRTALAKKRGARQNGQKSENINGGNTTPTPSPTPPSQSQASQKLSEQVLAVLDAENLPPEIETAVFSLLRYLRKEGK